MRRLEGFHIRQMYRLARDMSPARIPKVVSGITRRRSVLEEVGLHTIEHYIDARRQAIANYIVKNEPIFELCRRRRNYVEQVRRASGGGSNLWT